MLVWLMIFYFQLWIKHKWKYENKEMARETLLALDFKWKGRMERTKRENYIISNYWLEIMKVLKS